MSDISSKSLRAAICLVALMAAARVHGQSDRHSIEQSQSMPSALHARSAAIVARATDPRRRTRFDAAVVATDATLARSSPAVRAWVADEGARKSDAGDPSTAGIARDARARFGDRLSMVDVDAIVAMVLAQAARDDDLIVRDQLAQLQARYRQQPPMSAIRGVRPSGNPHASQSLAQPMQAPSSEHPARSPIAVATNDPGSDQDGMNDMSEETSMRLQMSMDNYDQAMEALSNIEKADAATADAIIANLK